MDHALNVASSRCIIATCPHPATNPRDVYCRDHESRYRRAIDPPPACRASPTCALPPEPHDAPRDWCWRHIRHWRLYGDPDAPSNFAGVSICRQPDCTRQFHALGLCRSHYRDRIVQQQRIRRRAARLADRSNEAT